MRTDYTKFGLEARRIMFENNISVCNLSKRLGVSDTYVHDIFKGNRVSNKYKRQIVKILGMSEKYLQ
jgi:transcriptional regulator with XRE-family HTH domain